MKDIHSKILDYIFDDNQEYKVLLKKTDINFTYFDESALITAVSCENEKIINELISMGANVNLLANNLTALSHASQLGKPKICKLLLDYGAKVELGHTHPIILFVNNYENLSYSDQNMETLNLLMEVSDEKIYEDVMTTIFCQDFIELFKYIMIDSSIPVDFRNSYANKLVNKYNCAPEISNFLKSKQFFDNLSEKLTEKDNLISKIIKI